MNNILTQKKKRIPLKIGILFLTLTKRITLP